MDMNRHPVPAMGDHMIDIVNSSTEGNEYLVELMVELL